MRFPAKPLSVAVCFLAVPTAYAQSDWKPIVGSNCTTFPSAGDMGITAGTAVFNRWERINNTAGAWQDFLNFAFTVGQSKQIEGGVAAFDSRADAMLRWSKEKGVLISVVMQRDTTQQQPPRHLYTEVVGVGSCPYDALVKSLMTPTPSLSRKPPAEGSVLDADSSFFYWIARDRKGALIRSIVAPGSQTRLVDRAKADVALKDAMGRRADDDLSKRLLVLAEEVRRQRVSADVRAINLQATAALKAADKERRRIDEELQKALAAQSAAADARGWVGQLSTVLAIGTLAGQVHSMLKTTAPQETLDKLKTAPSAAELSGVISLYEKEQSSRIETLNGTKKSVLETYKIQRLIITDQARKTGAPNEVLP